jgi:hypothetical protein
MAFWCTPGCQAIYWQITLIAFFFEDWIDSFYARDIQELFNVRNRSGFLKLFHLIGFQSGGQMVLDELKNVS